MAERPKLADPVASLRDRMCAATHEFRAWTAD